MQSKKFSKSKKNIEGHWSINWQSKYDHIGSYGGDDWFSIKIIDDKRLALARGTVRMHSQCPHFKYFIAPPENYEYTVRGDTIFILMRACVAYDTIGLIMTGNNTLQFVDDKGCAFAVYDKNFDR